MDRSGGQHVFSVAMSEGQVGTKIDGVLSGGTERKSSYYSFWKEKRSAHDLSTIWIYGVPIAKSNHSLMGLPYFTKSLGGSCPHTKASLKSKTRFLLFLLVVAGVEGKEREEFTGPLPILSQDILRFC